MILEMLKLLRVWIRNRNTDIEKEENGKKSLWEKLTPNPEFSTVTFHSRIIVVCHMNHRGIEESLKFSSTNNQKMRESSFELLYSIIAMKVNIKFAKCIFHEINDRSNISAYWRKSSSVMIDVVKALGWFKWFD